MQYHIEGNEACNVAPSLGNAATPDYCPHPVLSHRQLVSATKEAIRQVYLSCTCKNASRFAEAIEGLKFLSVDSLLSRYAGTCTTCSKVVNVIESLVGTYSAMCPILLPLHD